MRHCKMSGRSFVGTLLAIAAFVFTSGPALAQKPLWEITEVKISGKAVSPKGDEQTEFGGDNQPRMVFLYVTVKYEKAQVANTLRAAQVLDKKKKVVGQLFNFSIDKDDKKVVTLVYKNTTPWESLEELQLRSLTQTTLLEKKEPPKK